MRVFQDGDFVFAHTDYDFFGPKIGFDIFRFEDGKIVEHWDNLQEKPARPNPSGHTMTDGPTEVTDLEKTAANKALVRAFVDDILVNGQMPKLADVLRRRTTTSSTTRRSPMACRVSGSALEAMAEEGHRDEVRPRPPGARRRQLRADRQRGRVRRQATSFYDLFRVEKGKIVEHWDTIEAIPARAQWKNNNGKF